MFTSKAANSTLILFLAFLFGSLLSYHKGKLEMERYKQDEFVAQSAKIAGLKEVIANKEKAHAKEISAIEAQQRIIAQRYDDRLAVIASNHAIELQQHEKRATNYRALSETRAAELAALAERYDRVITDGVAMAERCESGIEARQRAIELLIKKIQADLRLINDGRL